MAKPKSQISFHWDNIYNFGKMSFGNRFFKYAVSFYSASAEVKRIFNNNCDHIGPAVKSKPHPWHGITNLVEGFFGFFFQMCIIKEEMFEKWSNFDYFRLAPKALYRANVKKITIYISFTPRCINPNLKRIRHVVIK